MLLPEGAWVWEFVPHIQEIQFELRGLGDPVLDVELVDRIVNTLPPNMDSVYQNILGLHTMPSFANLVAHLLQAETRAQLRGTTTTKEDALAVHMQNLSLPADKHHAGHHASTSHRRSYIPGGSRHKNLQCYFCKEGNHLMRTCPELIREIAKHARDRRNRGRWGGRRFQNHWSKFDLNLVIEEYSDSTPTTPSDWIKFIWRFSL